MVLSSAIGYLMTPRLVGGNSDKAMAGFRRAAKLFARENPADPIHPVWGHSDTYIWTGIAYLERKDLEGRAEGFRKRARSRPGQSLGQGNAFGRSGEVEKKRSEMGTSIKASGTNISLKARYNRNRSNSTISSRI